MKISFLGTSHGSPEDNRFCSSTLIEAGDALYLIDAGAPVLDLLTRRHADFTRLRALFTTHFHADHVIGIFHLALLMNKKIPGTSLDIYLTEQRAIDMFLAALPVLGGEINPDHIRFHLITEKDTYQDENIRLTPFPTQHLAYWNRPALSYLLEAEGKKVIFSGDLSARLEDNDFPAYALENEVDLLILEMAHQLPEHHAPFLEKCKAKQVAFTHISKWDEKVPGIRAMDQKFGFPIRTVLDGDEIIL